MTECKEYTLERNGESIPCKELSDPLVMAKEPLVSVRMSTYNHEPYIAQAIEGVLMQETSFPIELIVAEDCSTDRTREIVLDYQRRHPDIIRVITADINVGSKKNGFRSRRMCRGKYMAICEGDDYWHHPQKLQMQVDYLEAHPECGLVHSDVIWNNTVTDEKRLRHYRDRGLIHEDDSPNLIEDIIMFKYHVMTCTAVLRKSLYELAHQNAAEVNTDLFPLGDLQVWIEMASLSKIKYFDFPLATYNQQRESACNTSIFPKRVYFTTYKYVVTIHYLTRYNLLNKHKREMKLRFIKCYRNCIISGQNDLLIRLINYAKKYYLFSNPTLLIVENAIFIKTISFIFVNPTLSKIFKKFNGVRKAMKGRHFIIQPIFNKDIRK